MIPRKYATAEELKNTLGLDAVPDDAEDLLVEASEQIDEILLASTYPTDSHGYPTTSELIEAFKRATLVMAKHRYIYGDETEIANSGGSMSLGPLSLGGTPAAGGGSDDRTGTPQIPSRVFRILRNVGGLLTTSPRN